MPVSGLTDLLSICAIGVGSSVAVWTDLRFGKIYNWLTLPLLLSGVFFHALQGAGFVFALQGAALGGKAVGLEGISQGIGNRWLVVHDENLHGDDGSAFRAARRHPQTTATFPQQPAASTASGRRTAKRRTMAATTYGMRMRRAPPPVRFGASLEVTTHGTFHHLARHPARRSLR